MLHLVPVVEYLYILRFRGLKTLATQKIWVHPEDFWSWSSLQKLVRTVQNMSEQSECVRTVQDMSGQFKICPHSSKYVWKAQIAKMCPEISLFVSNFL